MLTTEPQPTISFKEVHQVGTLLFFLIYLGLSKHSTNLSKLMYPPRDLWFMCLSL